MDGSRAPALVADSVLALLLAGLGIAGTAALGSHRAPDQAPVSGLAFVLVVVAALALAGRRVWPVATLTLATLAVSVYLVRGYPYGPIMFSVRASVVFPASG